MKHPGQLFDLGGRVALVAGGGGYLGRDICDHLAAHGADVIVADCDGAAAEAVCEAVKRRDNRATIRAEVLDVAEASSIDAVMANVGRWSDGLDVVVNAVAFSRGKPLEEVSVDDWSAGLHVSLTGAMLLSRAAARLMLARGGGSIVNLVSMYALVSPDPRAYPQACSVNPPDYGAAKAGLLQLTRYEAVMWARHGIRVNAIAPGPFPNPKVQAENAEMVRRLAERSPMGRIGQSHEVPGAVVFLASDASSYVTGTVIAVDGGWTAW